MSKSKQNKIEIKIDWDSKDCGYSVLKSNKMKNFLFENLKNGKNLINSQNLTSFKAKGKTVLKLQAISYKKWYRYTPWSRILCDKYSTWLKGSPCSVGRDKRLFVKLESNEHIAGFALYIMAILMGQINLKKHKQFVKTLQKIFKNDDVYIHNTDLHYFHLKRYL